MTTTPKQRVAIVYQLDRLGGVQSCAFALIRGLNQLGITPDILWDRPPDWALLKKMRGQAGYGKLSFRISSRVISRAPDSLRYLLKIANCIQGDKLRSQYDFFYIFYNGFLLSPDIPHLRYLSGPPLVPQLNNFPGGIKGAPVRLFQWLYRRWLCEACPAYEYHRGSQYVINSQFTAALFEQAHGIRLPVIHPPIVVPNRSFVTQDWQQRDTVTFFSRIIAYKRPEWLIDLASRHPDLRGVIMGGVPDHRRSYFDHLREKAPANLTFLANPSNERVQQELARTRYYVFPARNEHFGMTTVEAIAAGAIPYVHDSGGQREIVPDERLRFQDEAFHEKFNQILALPSSEIHELRRSLFAHIGQFSEDVFVRKMLAYLPA